MAKSLAISFGVIALLGRVSLAKEVTSRDIVALQPNSLLQVGTFQERAFSVQSWGRDAEEDAKDQFDEATESEAGEDRDVNSEGLSALQITSISSDRAGQHAIQYPQASPIMVQSQGSTLKANGMPGTLRQAFVQSIPQGAQATSQATPQAPVAGLVSMATSATYENTSDAAFGQLAALEAEFKELRADDSFHVNQLMYGVHLREQLRDQLRTARDQLEKDNAHLAERTAEIVPPFNQGEAATGEAATGNQVQGTRTEEAPNTTLAAMLLQAAISSTQHREVNNEQIAAKALDRVQVLMKDIAALKQRDDEEMQALSTNAHSREALRAQIDKRRQQLQTDTGVLFGDLSQIRGLVQHESEMPGAQAAQTVSDMQQRPQAQSDGESEMPGAQAAQTVPDMQQGPQPTSDAQVPTSGQQPTANSEYW